MADRERKPGYKNVEAETSPEQEYEEYASSGPPMRYHGAIPPIETRWVDQEQRPLTASERVYGRSDTRKKQSMAPAGVEGSQAAQGCETAERADERQQKHVLIEQVYKYVSVAFRGIDKAGDTAIQAIEVAEIPKTDLTKTLLGYAASTLLGGGSAAAVTWMLGSITTAGVTGAAAAAVKSLVGGAVAKALQGDHARAAGSLDDIKRAFYESFVIQVQAAEHDFTARWPTVYAGLSQLGIDELTRLNQARVDENQGEFVAAMRHQAFIAWTNFLARVKHGAMGPWDHWAENGSPGAIALPGAQHKPVAGGPDPSRNNVAPDSDSPLLQTIQRPMQDDAFGILEIFVDASGGRIVNRPGYRMRLDNVGPKVREEFKTSGKKVRELPVNKIVHLCSSLHNGVRVDPPTSVASVLITADGYVRASNWAEFLKVHFEPKKGPIWDPAGFGDCMDQTIQGKETADCHIDRKAMSGEISAFATAAQELPLTWLEA